MSFTWPLALLLVLAVPAVLAVYLLTMRRRRKQAVSYSSVALLRSVVPARSRWQRHLPVALLLSSLGVLAIGSARPQVVRDVPTARTSVILALDVSRSMCATDVDPNRMTVAQQAAKEFVESQPKGVKLGLVVFSGFAQLAVAPTEDHDALVQAIERLTTGRGTAVGTAMLKALDAIAEVNPDVLPVGDVDPSDLDGFGGGLGAGSGEGPAADPAGDYVPDVIVLLTDGASTRGIPPLAAVPYAVERRVRVFTIGFGTSQPTGLACSRQQLGGDTQFGGFGGGGGGGGGRNPLRADNDTLEMIAERTGGTAYTAEDAPQLREVFASLPKDVTTQEQEQEITTWFVAFGALLAAAAVAASIRWSAYPS